MRLIQTLMIGLKAILTLEGKEEVIHLGDYEKTLTLLTFYGDYEDVLEEENMVASWEAKFR